MEVSSASILLDGACQPPLPGRRPDRISGRRSMYYGVKEETLARVIQTAMTVPRNPSD